MQPHENPVAVLGWVARAKAIAGKRLHHEARRVWSPTAHLSGRFASSRPRSVPVR